MTEGTIEKLNYITKDREYVLVMLYPPWLKLKDASKIFGISIDKINEWRSNGYVACRAVENSVQVRCSDIDKCMHSDYMGKKPPRIGRSSLKNAMKR